MVTKPTRVTQVVFDLDGGGLESIVGQMARRWAGTNVVLSIVTLSGRVGRVGVSIRDLVDQFHVLRPLAGLSMVVPVGLARAIRSTQPDVVHLHSGAWYKAALAARLAGARRVIYTEHGREHNDPPLARWLDRRAAMLTDVVVTVSERLRGYMIGTVGIRADRVITVPNGVDTGLFAPGPASCALAAALGIGPGTLVVGSVGRLEAVKAYRRLLEAFAALCRIVPPVPAPVLLLAGDGSQRVTLSELASTLGIGERVRLPGWLDGPADVYRLLKVFVLTSLSEGMSLSLLEAMACGAVPVVTDVGSNAEVLGPELADYVVAADAGADEIAVRIATASGPAWECMSGVARRRVVECYGFEQMLSAYEKLYVA